MRSIEYKNNSLILLNQTKLPSKIEYITCSTYRDVGNAIKNMIVRGAPAIGVSAAYGIYLGARTISTTSQEDFLLELSNICDYMKSTRPTAVNLFFAIDYIFNKAKENINLPVNEIKDVLLKESQYLECEDVETNKAIGNFGNTLIEKNWTILTHCNAGALATCGYGTALGIIRSAHYSGKNVNVFADETRPYMQGSRLTSFELHEDGIPVTLICDNMAGHYIKSGIINCIIVGADRIALNGDTANKIGTYTLSVLAKEHNIPFYVAAPISTIDFSITNGDCIPIEERDVREVSHINDVQLTPDGINIKNPSFDVTPSQNITSIITEKGVIKPPYLENISKLNN